VFMPMFMVLELLGVFVPEVHLHDVLEQVTVVVVILLWVTLVWKLGTGGLNNNGSSENLNLVNINIF